MTLYHPCELPPDKSGWLPPTIPKDLLAQHIPEQERDVVGSALKGPVYQGQPVNHKNNVDTDIDFAMQEGTIHPPDKSSGILYPSTPRSNLTTPHRAAHQSRYPFVHASLFKAGCRVTSNT